MIMATIIRILAIVLFIGHVRSQILYLLGRKNNSEYETDFYGMVFGFLLLVLIIASCAILQSTVRIP